MQLGGGTLEVQAAVHRVLNGSVVLEHRLPGDVQPRLARATLHRHGEEARRGRACLGPGQQEQRLEHSVLQCPR